MTYKRPVLRILGIRGIPAAHGGFETFAENLSTYLVGKGWRVVVYCQEDGDGVVVQDDWCGVERIRIPVSSGGVLGTVVFDWRAISHACQYQDLCLTLGYNTALFCARLRVRGIPNLINMDGIEWSRAKWGPFAKTWFWLNDWAGCWLGDHLVADHPEIKRHLSSRVSAQKITTIAYGAQEIRETPIEVLGNFNLKSNGYLTLIARPEPENSILEVVRGFSARARGIKLVVLGCYDDANSYHRTVKKSASNEVMFLGAIYDKGVVQALRKHCLAYVHGHQVGGTNPSLVEAMGAGNAVLAHDNPFNKWVVGSGARYFVGSGSFDSVLSEVLRDKNYIDEMRVASQNRFSEMFTWGDILGQYEGLLSTHLPQE
jgi:glycosyltransferase involved in cell wall biosynthesis